MNSAALVAVALHPALPIQAGWQTEPALRTLPLVVAVKDRVFAACPRAAQAGIAVGDHLTQARQACPGLMIRSPDAAAAAVLYGDMLETALTLTPCVEAADPSLGLAYLDARGLERRWPGPAAVAGAVRRRLAARGLAARAAAGPIRLIARALLATADQEQAAPVCESAGAAAFLGALPLAAPACGLSPRQVTLLDELGIRTAALLATLPRSGLLARYGPEVAACRDAALGMDGPLRPYRPPERLLVQRRAESPVDDLLLLDALLSRLAGDLAERLAERHQATGLLTLRLEDEQRGIILAAQHRWPPIHTIAAVSAAVQTLRARCALAAPIAVMGLHAALLQPRATHQLSLWGDPRAQRRARLKELLAAEARKEPYLFGRWRRTETARDGWTRDPYIP